MKKNTILVLSLVALVSLFLSKKAYATDDTFPNNNEAYTNYWYQSIFVDATDTKEFIFCGKDGYAEIDIKSIKNTVESETDLYTYSDDGVVYISTQNGSILKIDDIKAPVPNETVLCNLGIPFTDIAVDENEVVYVTSGSQLYTVDISSCALTAVPDIHEDYSAKALSFDVEGNLYYGGSGSSLVYRYDQNEATDAYVWHDFGTGSAAGDFVILNGKMYIAWEVSRDNVRLFEVDIDSDFNYLSHVDLGALDDTTYGLASENGELFGIAAYSMYKISLDPLLEDKVYWNATSGAHGQWWGAAGLHEAQKLNIAVYESPDDLIKGENELPDLWINTVKNGQILHVKLENEETGEIEIKEVTILVVEAPNPGEDAVIDVCSDTSIDLFTELGGLAEIGGVWTDPDGNIFGTNHLESFDPKTNLFGTYTYTIKTIDCEESATINVRKTSDFDAGLPNSISLCTQDRAINLFDFLLGTPDLNGIWRDPNGVDFGTDDKGELDPSITGVLSGDYQYVLFSSVCNTETSEKVTVDIKTLPMVINENITICSGEGIKNLIDKITTIVNSSGTWLAPDGTTFGTNDQGEFDPMKNVAGNYSYIEKDACGPNLIVSVALSSQANSGIAAIAELCSNDASISLFDKLGGTPDAGGTWTDPNGVAFGTDDQGNLDPSIIGILSGNYTYTVATTECPTPAKTIVEVKINQAPNLGIDASLTVCTGETMFNLFDKLGGTPDTGGVWKDPNGIVFGVDYLGSFDPSLTTNVYGIYSYSINTPFCKETFSTVEVLQGASPDSGTTTSIALCTTDMALNLFDKLGGTPDAGGTWTDPNGVAFGTDDQGNLDPSVIGILSGNYTYTVATTECPTPAKTIVEVKINQAPNLGIDASLTVCAGGTMFNLFDKLGGTPDTGGAWKNPNGIVFGVDYLGSFAPSLTTNVYGIYSYSINTPFCKETFSTVEVLQGASPDSGTTTSIALCTTDMALNLFNKLGGTPDAGGTWTDPNGVPFGTDDQGSLDPSVIGILSGNYTYTVATTECPTPVKTIVEVNVETTPEIYLDDKVISVDGSTYDVFFVTNGTWNVSASPNVGEIDVLNSKITKIPYGIDVEITVENPLNTICFNSLSVVTPIIVCPTIDVPINPSNELICYGDNIPELSVEVKTSEGELANWYTQDGQLLKEKSITYTPEESSIIPNDYTFLVETVNATGLCFSQQIPVSLSVKEIPQIELIKEGTLCLESDGSISSGSDVYIDSGLPTGVYTFEWKFEGQIISGETGASIPISEPGNYQLNYKYSSLNSCSNDASINIEAFTAAEKLDLKLSSGTFSSQNNLIVTVTGGTGNFEYNLDDGDYQTSNVFENISLGNHKVTAVDIDGCGLPIEGAKYVMGFPGFFTPNGDNKNDIWNIELDPTMESMDISIFVYDRFGKLIQQVFPDKQGWDGTFAGKNMPSDDYWFIATNNDTAETYTSHFTLVR